MSHTLSARDRKLKAKILSVFRFFRLKAQILSTQSKIALIGTIITLVSLTMPWLNDNSLQITAFNGKMGHIGILVLIITLFTLFILVSNNNKEKLKLNTQISFRDYSIVLGGAVLNLLLTFVSVNFIRALGAYSQSISHGDGIVYSSIGGIFMLIGGILMYREHREDLKNIVIDVSEGDESNTKVVDEKNMKLPF